MPRNSQRRPDRLKRDYLLGLLGLAVQQQTVGAVGRQDGADEEQSSEDAGKAQAEAPSPRVVLHTCALMQLSAQER